MVKNETTKNKRLCIIQMHYTDILQNDYIEKYNSIKIMCKSNIVDDVVLAVADMKENLFLKNKAKEWGCHIRFGAIDNVTERFYTIAQEFNAGTYIRLLAQYYFIDLTLINNMFQSLEQNDGDILLLPRDFDFRFGGDVFSKHYITTIFNYFEKNNEIKNTYKFNPFAFSDTKEIDGIKKLDFIDIPVYDRTYFKKFRKLYNTIWPEHFDKANSPEISYQSAKQYIHSESTVLDISCGFGNSSNLLSTFGAKNVVGVDYSKEAINTCIARYGNTNKLSFICDNALNNIFPPSKFDIICSIHTMEHIVDDKAFMQNLHKWLKDDGILILEVPLMMEYPFKGINTPLSNYHIREYFKDELIDLVANYCNVINIFGISRGFLVDIQFARNAVLVIAKKS